MDKAILHPHGAGKTLPPAPADVQRGYLEQWPRWSLGVRTANLIFLSGMGGVDTDGVPAHVDDPMAQVQLTLSRIVTALELAGGRADDLVKVRVFLDDPSNARAVLEGIEAFFATHLGRWPGGGRPALCMVVANTSNPSIHTEIEVIAATGHVSVTSARLSTAYSPLNAGALHAHAVRVGSLLFTSGMLPLDDAGRPVSGDVAAQLDRVLVNLGVVLEDSGAAPGDLVKLTVWIAEASDVDVVTGHLSSWIRAAFPDGDFPAVTVLVAPIAQPGMSVQLEAVASTAGRRCVAQLERSDTTSPLPASAGVVVPLHSPEGSYLRRFTWPDHPTDLDPALYAGLSPHDGPMGHLLFVSAQSGARPDGSMPETMTEQARLALEKTHAITTAAGAAFADLVQFDIYYNDRSRYGEYNRVRVDYLEEHNPDKEWFAGSGPKARSARPGAHIELESIAIVPGERRRPASAS